MGGLSKTFFFFAIFNPSIVLMAYPRQYFKHDQFPYQLYVEGKRVVTPSPEEIPGLSYAGKPFFYDLPSKEELTKKYQCDSTLIDTLGTFNIIPDILGNASRPRPSYDLQILSEGHTPVFTHSLLPNHVIKVDRALERIHGAEVLKNICAINPHLCKDIIIPHKCILPINNNYILLAEKIQFIDTIKDQCIDFVDLLKRKRDLFERVKFLLYQAGYCDGSRGNIKITPNEHFAIIDTDFGLYLKPYSWCGASQFLEKAYYDETESQKTTASNVYVDDIVLDDEWLEFID